MITLNDLIAQVKFDDIKKALIENYPNQTRNIEGYEKVFNELQLMTPVARTNENWQLDVHMVNPLFEDEEPYMDVSGLWLNSTEPEQHWALEFTPWEEWLSIFVNKQQVETLGKETYVAHCLWEMTFNGFEQETIQDKINMLDESEKEIKVKEVADIELSGEDVLETINDTLGDTKI
jgi:hypothetical protein